jgi:hypothetical protein
LSIYDTRLREWYDEVKEYMDKDFLCELEIEENRISRESELILAHELFNRGYKFKKRPQSEGPDFLLEYEGKRIWIEVVAPNEGSYPVLKNQIKEEDGGVSGWIDENNCKIKISSVLYDKKGKYLGWKEKGIVRDNDVRIICINVCNLSSGPQYWPYVVSVLYGKQPGFYFDAKSQYVEIEVHPPISKPTGNEIEMGLFNHPNYHDVDGVLWFDYHLGIISENCEIQFLANYNRKKLIGNLFGNLDRCVIPPDE